MIRYIAMAAGAALCAAAAVLLMRWRGAASRKKRDREQADRKAKEDALDRALANPGTRRGPAQAETPVEVHYKNSAGARTGAMVRLTQLSESVAKEYLFQRGETIYLGEELGHAAVFREKTTSKIFCELFPYNGGFFVCRSGGAPCRLLRGKRSAELTSKPVRLHGGDRVETRAGMFLVEFL